MKPSSSSLRVFLRRLIDRARGVPIEHDMGVYRPLLDAICGREDELRAAAKEALAARAAGLAERMRYR